MPRIRKQQIDALEAGFGEHFGEYLDGIMVNHAHVLATGLSELEQQVADTRTVDLDADVITLGVEARHLCQALPVTETDLDIDRVVVAEQRGEIERLVLKIDAPPRPQGVKGALLAGCQAALTQHVAADLPMRSVGCSAVHALTCSGLCTAQSKNRPSSGDDAEAKRLAGMRPAR